MYTVMYTANIYRCMKPSIMKEFLSLYAAQFLKTSTLKIWIQPLHRLELMVQILIRGKVTFHRPSKSLTSQRICTGHRNQYFSITFPCSIKVIFLCNWKISLSNRLSYSALALSRLFYFLSPSQFVLFTAVRLS